MSKSTFHDIGNQLLIAKGMVEISFKNTTKADGLTPEMKESIAAKLQLSIDALNKINGLLQTAKKEYLYKDMT